ncbi:MAG TPA: alpha/beta fold hydrolase [Mycobacteriales bacterium]|nr:alpha/beta fold hydrolase [Mycobacteriales bacterium]
MTGEWGVTTNIAGQSPWEWFVAELDRVVVDDPAPADGTLVQWQEHARPRLLQLLGAMPEPVPLDVQRGDETDVGPYRRIALSYAAEQHMRVPCWLLVPHQPRGSGVVALHGHGAGRDEVCGLAPTEDRGAAYADSLARAGHVVLAPDQRGFGQRRDWQPDGIYHCDYDLTLATLLGVTVLGRNVWDAARALDALGALPEVDAARLGVAGLSYGGTTSLFLAAVDPRVRAAVVAGYLSSWSACARIGWNMCGSQVVPGIARAFDHADLAALVAPRALLAQSGEQDQIFPVASARATAERVTGVYRAAGAADAFAHDVQPTGHAWTDPAPVEFLTAHL